jgi:3-phenylpropionate/trans-cinnamate dioxygenase ferredoxin reductase subunit
MVIFPLGSSTDPNGTLGFCAAARQHRPMSETHVIIGAGQAGGWAAIAMRQAGFAGHIILVGDEPWRPYERPPLSKAVLTEATEPPLAYFHAESRYAEQGIELLLGCEATELDVAAHRVRLHDGRSLPYDRLLLTVGGRARHLPIHGGDKALYLRTIEDARLIRARLATARRVICIGVIGLEIASSARAHGAEVTVLEALPRPMGRSVSPEGAAFIEALHRGAGVDMHFGIIVDAIEDGMRVTSRSGEVFEGDLVIAGVGMQRNLALAETAGLSLEGGIIVDEFGRTSAPDVYAAGDVAAFHHPLFGHRLRQESWRHAQNHGIAVGKAMCGDPTPYDDIPWFWTDQHGVNLQVAGLPADAAQTIIRASAPPNVFTAVHLAEDGSVIGVTAANSPRDIRAGQALIKSRRPVDAQALADASIPLQRLIAR